MTKWQALEYVTSQNFDRRAFASLNCITVVPGSVGAWRRSVLEETGGFSADTLAEDQDLTIQVRKLGYRIGYEEAAIGLTEAPDTLRSLAKQRFRWSYGTLQCMWKHKRALLNPRYGTLGFVAMPNVWIFQVFFPLISPIMDLLFVWTLVSALLSALSTPTGIRPHADESQPGRVLLLPVSRGRLDRCVRGIHDGEVRGQEAARVAADPAIRLPPGDVLGDGQIGLYRRSAGQSSAGASSNAKHRRRPRLLTAICADSTRLRD